MTKFARANLAAPSGALGRVLARTHERRRDAGRPDLSIGLGWIIPRAADRDVLWHNGGTAGYRSWLGLDSAPSAPLWSWRIRSTGRTNSPSRSCARPP